MAEDPGREERRIQLRAEKEKLAEAHAWIVETGNRHGLFNEDIDMDETC